MLFGYDKFISEFCKIKVIIQVLYNYKPSQNKDFGSKSRLQRRGLSAWRVGPKDYFEIASNEC
jgi:hypothetical protein